MGIRRSVVSEKECTLPLGWLPAEWPWKRLPPRLFNKPSDMIEQAELWVQTKSNW